MAQPRLFVRSGSPDLAWLVQDRLQKVQEGFPALCPSTLDELQVVADKLSAIAEVCQAVTKTIAADKMQPQRSSRSNKPSTGLSVRFLAEIFGTAD
jgi:hypothetical protein